MRNDKDNLIVDITFEFSLEAINYCESLEQYKKLHLSNQLINAIESIFEAFTRIISPTKRQSSNQQIKESSNYAL